MPSDARYELVPRLGEVSIFHFATNVQSPATELILPRDETVYQCTELVWQASLSLPNPSPIILFILSMYRTEREARSIRGINKPREISANSDADVKMEMQMQISTSSDTDTQLFISLQVYLSLLIQTNHRSSCTLLCRLTILISPHVAT